MQVYFKSGEQIHLSAKEFAGGGEGNLYEIVAPQQYRNLVAKIYHREKRTQDRETKINYLINHPPVMYSMEQAHHSVIWPLKAIYDKEGAFLGFVMPKAKGEKLDVLCAPNLPRNLGKQWQRFDRKQKNHMLLRIKVCFNIAAAIFQIHGTGHYVLVDMKPANILIQPNGLISIIDIDSLEIYEQAKGIHYHAAVVTLEFAPPEYHQGKIKPNKELVYDSWDRFSMAIIFYRLLCGIHPYAGSCNEPYDRLVALDQKIEHGLFVHSPSKQSLFRVIPPPHKVFDELDENLRTLFLQCFEDGHSIPDARPSADEWCATISFQYAPGMYRPLPSSFISLALPPSELMPVKAEEKRITSVKDSFASIVYLPERIIFEGSHTTTRMFLWASGTVAILVASYGLIHMNVLSLLGDLVGVGVIGGLLNYRYNRLPEMKMRESLYREMKQLTQANQDDTKKIQSYEKGQDGTQEALKKVVMEINGFLQTLQKEEKEEIADYLADFTAWAEAKDMEVKALHAEEKEKRKELEERFKMLVEVNRLIEAYVRERDPREKKNLSREMDQKRKKLHALYRTYLVKHPNPETTTVEGAIGARLREERQELKQEYDKLNAAVIEEAKAKRVKILEHVKGIRAGVKERFEGSELWEELEDKREAVDNAKEEYLRVNNELKQKRVYEERLSSQLKALEQTRFVDYIKMLLFST